MEAIERTHSKNYNDALPYKETLCASHPVGLFAQATTKLCIKQMPPITASISVYSLQSEQHELEANRPT